MMTVLTISILALSGGLGYAAFTSTATANINATAGTLNLYFSSASVSSYSSTYGETCNVYVSGSQLYVSYTNVVPGDTCVFAGTISNSGTLPATSVSVTYYDWQTYATGAVQCDANSGAGNCMLWLNDNIQGTSGPTLNLGQLTELCSPNMVGTTFASAAVCPLTWNNISTSPLNPGSGSFIIAASSSGATYSGTLLVIGPGVAPHADQLGAQQGQSAYIQVQITGSVGT